MFADYHVHTEFSDDSVYPMEQVVRDAIARGMDEICFTDHVDYGIKQDWDCGKPISYRGEEPLANVDYPVYIARIKELQETYSKLVNVIPHRCGKTFFLFLYGIGCKGNIFFYGVLFESS